jgi:Domain of unknown function (DUF5680)
LFGSSEGSESAAEEARPSSTTPAADCSEDYASRTSRPVAVGMRWVLTRSLLTQPVWDFLADAWQDVQRKRGNFGDGRFRLPHALGREHAQVNRGHEPRPGSKRRGRAVVFVKGRPLWMMVYYGWVDGMDADVQPVYSFLQGALRQAPAELPLRGPEEFSDGPL